MIRDRKPWFPWPHALALATAFAWAGACAGGGGGATSGGNDGGGQTDATSCTGSQVSCSGSCVDTSTDPSNCGKCGGVCGKGNACVGGSCGTSCPSPSTLCTTDAGSRCVDTQADNANCGSCSAACPQGQVCTAGSCSASCPSGQMLCVVGGMPLYCANTMTDSANCGSCGDACAQGQVCSAGKCSTTCQPDETLCEPDAGPAYCANTMTDNSNCGACGVACSGGEACGGSPPTCSCSMGLTVCGTRCVDYSSDPDNCGSCDHPCPTVDDCISGACVGPVAYWPFEGTLDDATGDSNDGTFQSGGMVAAAPYVTGYAGQAVTFNAATDDWIEVATPNGTPLAAMPRSLEAWVQPGALADPTYNGVIAYGVEACDQGQLLSMTQAYQTSSANWCNDLIETTGATGASGAWSHVAFTFDGTTRRLYLDGLEVDSDTPTGIATAAGPLRIGSTDEPGRSWTGVIDEARVYDSARSAANILDDATLAAHYTFDAADGTDIGPNHDTATPYDTSATSGRLNGALLFNGVDSYVLAPIAQLDGPQSLSVEAWIFPNTGGVAVDEAGQTTVGTGWHDSWIEVETDGTVNVRVWNCPALKAGRTNFSVWTHVALVYDAAGISVTGYVDGVPGASESCTRSYPASGGDAQYLAFGAGDTSNMGDGAWFNGSIDEIRVYTRVRTAAEILFDATP